MQTINTDNQKSSFRNTFLQIIKLVNKRTAWAPFAAQDLVDSFESSHSGAIRHPQKCLYLLASFPVPHNWSEHSKCTDLPVESSNVLVSLPMSSTCAFFFSFLKTLENGLSFSCTLLPNEPMVSRFVEKESHSRKCTCPFAVVATVVGRSSRQGTQRATWQGPTS